MKYLRLMAVGVLAVSMLSGCAPYRNTVRTTVVEKTAEKDDEDNSFDSIIDEVKSELNDELKSIDWAYELFNDFSAENNGKPTYLVYCKDGNTDNGEIIEDTENFINGMGWENWEKTDSLPEGAEAEDMYILEQAPTNTVLGNNDEAFRIACIITYKDMNYVTVTALNSFTDGLDDFLSEDCFTSVYKVSDDAIDCLRR